MTAAPKHEVTPAEAALDVTSDTFRACERAFETQQKRDYALAALEGFRLGSQILVCLFDCEGPGDLQLGERVTVAAMRAARAEITTIKQEFAQNEQRESASMASGAEVD